MLLFLLVMVAAAGGDLNYNGLDIRAEIHPLAYTNNTLSDTDAHSGHIPQLIMHVLNLKHTEQSDDEESPLNHKRKTAVCEGNDRNCATNDNGQLSSFPHDSNSEENDARGYADQLPPGSLRNSRRPPPTHGAIVRKADDDSSSASSEGSGDGGDDPPRHDCREFICIKYPREYICGSDRQTYLNHCHLDWYNHCFYKFVEIKKKGKCKSPPGNKPPNMNGNWNWNNYWQWIMGMWGQGNKPGNNGNQNWNNYWNWISCNLGQTQQQSNNANNWNWYNYWLTQQQGSNANVWNWQNYWQWVASQQQQGNQQANNANAWYNYWLMLYNQQQGNQWGQQQGNQWGQQGNQWGQAFDLDKWAQGDSMDLGGPIDQMILMNVWNQGVQQGLWDQLDQVAG